MTIVIWECIIKLYVFFVIKYVLYQFTVGGAMEGLEFSRELVKILDKDILQKALKKAGMQGFTIQGFDKNVWRAPIAMVSAALEKRKRGGKYQYSIFLECIARLEEDNEGINLAKKWLENGEERIEAEKILLETVSHMQTERNAKITELKGFSVLNDTEKKHDKKTDVEIQQEKRINKLQKTVQEVRILKDNYKKEIEQLKKGKTKLEKKYVEEKNNNITLIENVKRLEKQVGEYHQQLIQKEEKINYYKGILEKAPNIVYFSKKKIDNEIFPLKKLEQIDEWRDEFVDEIEWKKYQEVWIVESDFCYPEIMNIRKMASGNVVHARSLKSLIMKVGGDK